MNECSWSYAVLRIPARLWLRRDRRAATGIQSWRCALAGGLRRISKQSRSMPGRWRVLAFAYTRVLITDGNTAGVSERHLISW